jgi:hypothetical protein
MPFFCCNIFSYKDCATLVRPVESEADLQRVNEMPNNEMRSEFVEQVSVLRKRIFKRVKPKMLLGRCISGPMLTEICKAYIDTVNRGQLPNIENAWSYVCRSECLKALQETELEV